MKLKPKIYLYEPILMAELILYNNSKLLEKNPDLYNDSNIEKIEQLKDECVELEQQNGKGLQKIKREKRNELRDLCYETYIPRDPNIFGEMISLMADKILTRPQFSNYTFKEEMKSLGIEYVLKYSYRFDPYRISDISNQYVSAFSYISTIIFSGILQTINSFNKEQEKIKKYLQEHKKIISEEENSSDIIPLYEDIEYRQIIVPRDKLDKPLIKIMKRYTIKKPTMFIIPNDYIITEDDLHYIEKYNIGIKRYKKTKEIDG